MRDVLCSRKSWRRGILKMLFKNKSFAIVLVSFALLPNIVAAESISGTSTELKVTNGSDTIPCERRDYLSPKRHTYTCRFRDLEFAYGDQKPTYVIYRPTVEITVKSDESLANVEFTGSGKAINRHFQDMVFTLTSIDRSNFSHDIWQARFGGKLGCETRSGGEMPIKLPGNASREVFEQSVDFTLSARTDDDESC